MIKIIFKSSVGIRETYIVDSDTTFKEFFNEHNIDTTVGICSVNGTAIGLRDMNSAIGSVVNSDECVITHIVKTENAR